jgi:hypothetical protein
LTAAILRQLGNIGRLRPQLDFATVEAHVIGCKATMCRDEPRRAMFMKAIVFWAVAGVVSAVVAGILAEAKRRNVSYWAAWSFLVPVIPLVILAFVPKNTGERTRPARLDDEAEA